MDYYDYYATSKAISSAGTLNLYGGILKGVAGFLGVIIFIAVAVAVVQIIGMWKIFVKAGEEGWKSIVPVYNMITLFKIAGINPLFVLVYLALPIPFIGAIAVLAVMIYLSMNLSKAFGKDTPFTVLLVLLPFIGYLVLGFSKDIQYVGNGNAQQGFQNGPMNPNQGYNPMGQNGPMDPNQGYNPMGQSGPMDPNQGYNPMGQSGPMDPNQGYNPMGQTGPMDPNQGYNPMGQTGPMDPNQGYNQMGQTGPMDPNQGYNPMGQNVPTNPVDPNQPNPPTGMPQ